MKKSPVGVVGVLFVVERALSYVRVLMSKDSRAGRSESYLYTQSIPRFQHGFYLLS